MPDLTRRQALLIFLTIMFICAILVLYLGFFALVFVAGDIIFYVFYNRCPYCHEYLDRAPLRGYCRHCGKYLTGYEHRQD